MAKTSLRSVAFQGEPGAFSSIAATKFLGSDFAQLPCATFSEVFQALSSKAVAGAVIPIENTLYGSVYENYDHLLRSEFPIIAETAVRIEHHLIALPGVGLRRLKRAFSHPVALAQCQNFFNRHPRIVATPFSDTAGSVRMITQSKLTDSAGIGSRAAAELYGGQILKSNIEDHPQNFTRFFLLSKHKLIAGRAKAEWKTSLVLLTPNVAGALFRVLACFALRDLNLTKIESRPLHAKPWEYLFYVDILGHPDQSNVQNALANLKEMSSFVKVLGTYQAQS